MTKELLQTYLDKNDLFAVQFAEQIGVTRGFVSHILNGRRRPGLDKAYAIEEATKGFVPSRGWRKPESKKRKSPNKPNQQE